MFDVRAMTLLFNITHDTLIERIFATTDYLRFKNILQLRAFLRRVMQKMNTPMQRFLQTKAECFGLSHNKR